MLTSLGVAFIVAFFIVRPFFLQSFYIPSGSMIPTFYENDRLMGSLIKYHLSDPQPGDIVIFKSTREADRKTYNLVVYKHVSVTNYIKRRYTSSDSRFCPDAKRKVYKKEDGLCFVPRKNVVAKAWVQFWPLDRMRIMHHARY